MINTIKLKVNNHDLVLELVNNDATWALIKKLETDKIIVQAHDYGDFEKVGDLGFSLPTNDQKITTKPGDLVLYEGNQISLFYNSNTWNYTKLGHIKNINEEELKNILGLKDVTLILSLD